MLPKGVNPGMGVTSGHDSRDAWTEWSEKHLDEECLATRGLVMGLSLSGKVKDEPGASKDCPSNKR